jgi:Mn2+/Fe2+ NRAMP family transporter
MLMASRVDVMGSFVIKRRLRMLGWLAVLMMTIAVIAMLATF